MLEHFHASYQVEPGRALRGQSLHGFLLIINFQARFVQMKFCDRKHLWSHINTADTGAFPGHCLGQDATPATHVQHRGLVQIKTFSDVPEAGGIEIVQRAERACRVPPARCCCIKFFLFSWVEICFSHWIHTSFSSSQALVRPPKSAMRLCHCPALRVASARSIVVNCPLSSTRFPATQTSLT